MKRRPEKAKSAKSTQPPIPEIEPPPPPTLWEEPDMPITPVYGSDDEEGNAVIGMLVFKSIDYPERKNR